MDWQCKLWALFVSDDDVDEHSASVDASFVVIRGP